MCGIVGCLTSNDINVKNVLINGLEKLEYRGYDSAGIALVDNKNAILKKQVGALINLKSHTKSLNIKANCGIGHTRWATHGKPTINNCHPHSSQDGKFLVVHNGIIENYLSLKEQLEHEGFEFTTDTDTEVIAHLLQLLYKEDFLEAVTKTIKNLRGSFALAIINKDEPSKLIAVRHLSPLIVCKNKNGLYLASDIPALIEHSKNMYILEDKEFAVLNSENNSIDFFDFEGVKISKKTKNINLETNAITKKGYSTFMEKEINEVFDSLTKTLDHYSTKNFNKLNLLNMLKNIDYIYFVACGTAFHSGMIGANLIENLCGIRTKAVIASEFRYYNHLIDEKTLCVFLSQSGETADTLAALKKAKDNNAKVLTITNVPSSSITRECDIILPTLAGPEIAVASTKAYNTQLLVCFLLTLHVSEAKNKSISFSLQDLKELKEAAQQVAKLKDYANITKCNKRKRQVFFIGRDLDYLTAMEGSLKLKEISYINSEAYPAGELKHGTLALIDENTLVVAIITNTRLKEKTLNAVHEVKARGASVLIVSPFDFQHSEYDYIIKVPRVNESLMPMLSVIPLQQLALNFSLELGYNPDKPRNLAKSVTVE